MEFIINYWQFIIVGICILTVVIYTIVCFFKKPTKEQLKSLKEWLLYAVTEAEKLFGSQTGQLKLRYVYNLFLSKFPVLAKLISFDMFSTLVDEALDRFKNLLSNSAIEAYVYPKEGY